MRGLAAAGALRTSAVGVARNRAVVAAALGPGAALLHRKDLRRAAVWGPAARRAVYERIWCDAAAALDGRALPEDDGVWRVEVAARATRVRFHHLGLDGDFEAPQALARALDKAGAHRALVEQGLPVPDHRVLRRGDRAEAARLVGSTDGPLVVKPANGTGGGAGVVCGVVDGTELARAVRWARRYCGDVLVERSVAGPEFRFLVLDGELLDVVRRRPSRLVGDGACSLPQLVSAENGRRERAGGWAGLTALRFDLDALLTARRTGGGLGEAVPDGQAVQVKTAVSDNAARDNETVPLEAVGKALVDDVLAAAATTGLRLAGVDVVTPSLHRPLAEAGGVVLEVNGTPGLHYHYVVRDRAASSAVAVPVLAALLGLDGSAPRGI